MCVCDLVVRVVIAPALLILVEPLWQVKQTFETLAWSNFADVQSVKLVWQSEHTGALPPFTVIWGSKPLAMPLAIVPLWQLTQLAEPPVIIV